MINDKLLQVIFIISIVGFLAGFLWFFILRPKLKAKNKFKGFQGDNMAIPTIVGIITAIGAIVISSAQYIQQSRTIDHQINPDQANYNSSNSFPPDIDSIKGPRSIKAVLGIVIDERSGVPVPGARVSFDYELTKNNSDKKEWIAETDSNGAFVLSGPFIRGEVAFISVKKEGYTITGQKFIVDEIPILIRLRRAIR
ncbi:MAG: carboxypeptidase-like regulatory domain-containing protein [Blastocatellia bacterium]